MLSLSPNHRRTPSEASAARLVIVASFKGGTGKSTVCANLGATLATVHARRVAVVDADPQTGSTFLGIPPREDPFRAPPVEAHGLRLYVGGGAFAHADAEDVAAQVERARPGVDVVLVDVRGTRDDRGHTARLLETPGLLVLGVPAAEPRSLPEIAKLAADAEAAGAELRLLVNRVQRRRVSREVVAALRRAFGGRVLEAEIPERVEVQEAEHARMPVVLHRPHGSASQAIRAAAAQLVREGLV